MRTAQSPASARRKPRIGALRNALTCLALALIAVTAYGQGGVPLRTVVNDKALTSSVSGQFGPPDEFPSDSIGDEAFSANGDSAVFARQAGGALTELLKIGDNVPSVPNSTNSHITSFSANLYVSIKGVFFAASYSLPDGLPHTALLAYSWSGTYTLIAKDTDTAPAPVSLAYGATLIPQGYNDNGDVAFTAAPVNSSGTNPMILFGIPFGGTANRIVAVGDTAATPATGSYSFDMNFISRLNNQGQILFAASTLGTGATPGTNLYAANISGTVTAVAVTNAAAGVVGGSCTTGPISNVGLPGQNNTSLNDSGVVVFSHQSSSVGVAGICYAVIGSAPAAVALTGQTSPTSGGGTFAGLFGQSVFVDGGNGLGTTPDVVFTAPVSAGTTTLALLRYHINGGATDVIAYQGETDPSGSGNTFASFPFFGGVNASNDTTVSFAVHFTAGGSGIYQQSGTGTPALLAISNEAAPVAGGGTFFDVGLSGILTFNNHNAEFLGAVATGLSTLQFGAFSATPGNPVILNELFYTGDSLPAGSPVNIVAANHAAAGHFVAFAAQEAGGAMSIFEADLSVTPPAITKVVTEGDNVPAIGGQIFDLNLSCGLNSSCYPLFLNANGQILFKADSGSGTTLFLATVSPSVSIAPVVTTGQATPIGGTINNWNWNTNLPNPLNDAGQVAFNATIAGLSGIPEAIFRYNPSTGTLTKIVAVKDAGPSGGTFTSINNFPVVIAPSSVDATGMVAFNAVANGKAGFYAGDGTATPQPVAVGGNTIGAAGTFNGGIQPYDSNANGIVAFDGFGSNGFLFGTNKPPDTNPPSLIAGQGSATPAGGTFNMEVVSGNLGFQNSVLAFNDENDAAFNSAVTTGGSASGLFFSPKGGALQSAALQGGAAPGGGIFNSFAIGNSFGSGTNPLLTFALGPNGNLVFSNSVTNGSPLEGLFLVQPNSQSFKILDAGDTALGGGTINSLYLPQNSTAGNAGIFTFWAGATGGNFSQAIYATQLPSGTNTATILLNSSPNPSSVSESVTLTATVMGSSGTPTGTVTFFDNGVVLGTSPLDGSGAATLPVSTFTAGSHPLSAQYSGDSNYDFADSNQVTQNVTGVATHFAVSAPASATRHTPFNFTVTAQDASNNTVVGYSGTVRFSSSDSLAALPANSTLTNGTGIFSATLATPGNQTITATDIANASITGISGPITLGGACLGTETKTWMGGTDLNWTTAANWNPTGVPTSGDSVCIASSTGTVVIGSLAAANQSITSIVTDVNMSFTSGPLTINGPATFAGNLSISGGTLTLNGTSGSSVSGTMTQSSGFLVGTDALAITGHLTWTSGDMCTTFSSGACTTPGTQATTTLSGGASLSGTAVLGGRTLNTSGGTVTSSGSYLALTNGAIVNNTTTWNVNGAYQFYTAAFVGGTATGTEAFNNNSGGTLTQTASGTANVYIRLNNSGTVAAGAGILNVQMVATSTGNWSAASGATLELSSGTGNTSTLSGSISGAGTLDFGAQAGTLNLTGTGYNVTGTTENSGGTTNFTVPVTSVGTVAISGGTATFETGATVTATAMTLSGGTMAGPDTLTVSGLLTWSGGDMCTTFTSGANPPCTTPGTQGTTNASGGASLTSTAVLGGRTLNTSGGTVTSSGSYLGLTNGAIVNNTTTWNVNGNYSFYTAASIGGTATGTEVFNNNSGGTLTQTASGTANVYIRLNNSGTVAAGAGILNVQMVATSTGSWSAVSGATLGLSSGTGNTSTLSGSISGVGTLNFGAQAGTLNLTGTGYNVTGTTKNSGGTTNFTVPVTSVGTVAISGGVANFQTGATVAATAMTLSGGTMAGPDTLNIGGLLTWSGGDMCTTFTSGANPPCTTPGTQGTTNASGGASLTSTAVLGGRTLNTSGGAVTSSGSYLGLTNGAIVNNTTTWNVNGNYSFYTAASIGGTATGTEVFNNNSGGTLTQTASGTANVYIRLNNSGTVAAGAGTLNVQMVATSTGSWSAASGATLGLSSGTGNNSTLSGSISGAGTLDFGAQAGTLNLTGTGYNVTGTTENGGTGTTNFIAPGTVTSVGAVVLTNGILNFSTGNPIPASTMTQSAGSSLAGTDTLNISGLLTWSGGTMCTTFSSSSNPPCQAPSGTQSITNANGGISSLGTGGAILAGRTLNTSGGTVTVSTGYLALTNGATVNNTTQWNVSSSFNLYSAAQVGGAGTGTFNNNTEGTFTNTASLAVYVPFDNDGGTVQANGGTLEFESASTFTQTAGNTFLNGGSIQTTNPLQIEGGALTGSGTVTGGMVASTGGALAPGTTTPTVTNGTIAFSNGASGTYSQTSGAFDVKISATGAGDFDSASASGTVTLGGTLNVTFDGYTPNIGDSFKILTFASNPGSTTFATTNLPTLPVGYGWQLTYNSASVVLSVVTVAVPAPTVTSVSPNNGSAAGGTTITITGTNLTGATAVKFGATAATSFTVNSATSITAISPAEGAGRWTSRSPRREGRARLRRGTSSRI